VLRLVHLVVIAGLVSASIYVYKIKFDATVQAESVAKIRRDIRRERDAIALLRAEWAQLDNPARIQSLADRHLDLREVEATQFDDLGHLPMRPPRIVPAETPDTIAGLIGHADGLDVPTGSIRQPQGGN